MTEVDPGDSAVPPYEGRKESADVDTAGAGADADTVRDGADIGGAERPRQSGETRAPEPQETERGATASPADEQPAAESPQDEPDPEQGTGPAHQTGQERAEDVPDDPEVEPGA